MDFTTFFAIIFFTGIHETRWKIPSNVFFVPHKFITLRDRYRNRWRIKTREIDGSWYLLDGWAKFVVDCSIDTMDVLSFTQSGPGLYDVNILGSEGDMREGVGYHMTDVELENENVDTFEEDFKSGNGRTKRSKSKTKDVTTPKSRIRVDPFGETLFTIGGIPHPNNTYFVTRLQRNRRNELYIPKDILNDENLEIPKKIKLVDTKGNTYTSYKTVWKGGRTFYKGGWNRLGRRNRLRDNDICICEFGEGDTTGYLFISFLRFTE